MHIFLIQIWKSSLKIWRVQKKRILIKNYFQEKLQHHLKRLSFLQKHGNLYDFLAILLENKSLDNAILLQVEFVDDLMNGFNVYKNINGANSATDLYLILPANPRKTVHDLFLNTPTINITRKFIYRCKSCLV